MQNKTSAPKLFLPSVILIASIIVAIYWVTGKLVNVYSSTITGAVFETLWLPMLLLVFIIPGVSFFYWLKNGFKINSGYFFSLVIFTGVLILFLAKNN